MGRGYFGTYLLGRLDYEDIKSVKRILMCQGPIVVSWGPIHRSEKSNADLTDLWHTRFVR